MEIAVCADPAQWDGFLDRTVGSTAFHRWRWLQIHSNVHDWAFNPLIVTERGRIVGVLPVLLRKRASFYMAAPVPFPYVGPVMAAEHLPRALELVEEWAQKNRVGFNRFEFRDGAESTSEALRSAAWDCRPDATFVVDLSHGSEEEFWRRTQRSVLPNLRKSHKRGVAVSTATQAEVQEWPPGLLQESYGVRGLPSPYASAVFRDVWDEYSQSPATYLRSASVAGRPGGLSIAFGYKDAVYQWVAGSFRNVRQYSVGTALNVDLILWALRRGYRSVDLVGSVDAGVAQFKGSFGAHREPYLIAQRAHSPVFRALLRLHKWRRTLPL